MFRGGVVSYTNAVKAGVLGVPEELLAQYTAVSGPVARAMAEGVRALTGSNLAVSVTGVAGPGPDDDGHPEGLVYAALTDGEHTWVRRLELGTGRRAHPRHGRAPRV